MPGNLLYRSLLLPVLTTLLRFGTKFDSPFVITNSIAFFLPKLVQNVLSDAGIT